MGSRIEEIDGMFDPSLSTASLQDFEHGSIEIDHSRHYGRYPSQHSGFRSNASTSRSRDTESNAYSTSGSGYSPPAWKSDLDQNSGFWMRQSNLPMVVNNKKRIHNSRENSEEPENENEESSSTSRMRSSPSMSPEKKRSPSPMPQDSKNIKLENMPDATKQEDCQDSSSITTIVPTMEKPNTLFKISFNSEVQNNTLNLGALFNHIGRVYRKLTRSWTSISTTVLGAIFFSVIFKLLFQPLAIPPTHDLVKVAGLAKSFEPLIMYAEDGASQVNDILQTALAVWDLGESVRSANMTSAPIIAAELDELSGSLKMLSAELTRFHANVIGDIDGIIQGMDWAKRELAQLGVASASSWQSAYDNIHTALSRAGVLESSNGAPTPLGRMATCVFGPTSPQEAVNTLTRAYQELMSVYEDAISNELTHSGQLYALFERVDQQLKVLSRSAARELDSQEMNEAQLLSRLWVKYLGAQSRELAKFEKNKKLLSNVHVRTRQNKASLLEHNAKVVTLNANLDKTRKRLVSPLVQANRTIRVDEQIAGIEEVFIYLGRVKDVSRMKANERLMEAGSSGGMRVVDAGMIDYK